MPDTATAARRAARRAADAHSPDYQAGWDDYMAGADYADRPTIDAARRYRIGWDAAAREAG